MNNIGYAIFKKTSNLVINANGMFEALQLNKTVSSIINTISLNEVGQKLLCYTRISSKSISGNSKDAYLITILELVKKDNEVFVLGSAICFKEFQVNSNKVIDGTYYLLKQLKHNFSNDYDFNESDLGVLLPSTNKDFKILKPEKLKYNSSSNYVMGFAQVSIPHQETYTYLNDFCNNNSLQNIETLLLSSSKALLNDFNTKGYQKINISTLTKQKEPSKQFKSKTSTSTDDTKIKNQLNAVIADKNKIQKNRNLFRILSLVLSCIVIFLGLLFFIQKKDTVKETNSSSLYTIEDTLYISHSGYNVNIRSSPDADSGDINIKTTLSDGDKVYVLGFDKETLWAKISYNEGEDIGYVSNRLISKRIDTDRVLPVYKKANINYSYSGIALYTSPKEIGKKFPEIILYLVEDDEVFVKNKDLRLNSYSVSFIKNNKIYHGYVEEQYINYQ